MKILIAGVGSIGRRHIYNLKALGYTNIILYRTGNHTIEKDEKIDSLKTFDNLKHALDQKPDVVFITNPTSLHMPIAIKSAKKGCHLFIEKPISHSMEGVEELKKIVDKNKLITFVACQFRFHPLIKKIKECVESSLIGKIVYVRAEWGEYLPDWHPWEDYSKGYSAKKHLGGGVILTQIHPIDYLYWIFGKISEIKSLYGKVSNLNLDVEDLAEIIIKFDKGIIGNVHVDYIQKPRVHKMEVVGLGGKIMWDCHGKMMEIIKNNGSREIIKDPENFERNTMFIDEVKHFIDCVKNNKETINPLEHGIDTLKVVLEAKNQK